MLTPAQLEDLSPNNIVLAWLTQLYIPHICVPK